MYKYPRTPHIEGSRLQPGDEDLDSVPFSAICAKRSAEGIASQFGSGYSGCDALGCPHPLPILKTVFLDIGKFENRAGAIAQFSPDAWASNSLL